MEGQSKNVHLLFSLLVSSVGQLVSLANFSLVERSFVLLFLLLCLLLLSQCSEMAQCNVQNCNYRPKQLPTVVAMCNMITISYAHICTYIHTYIYTNFLRVLAYICIIYVGCRVAIGISELIKFVKLHFFSSWQSSESFTLLKLFYIKSKKNIIYYNIYITVA